MSYEHLEHHGILGQKWGVRRFQNRDGSYTAEGRKRHAADGESSGSKIKSGLRKTQHIADKATIIRAKTKVGSTDTYDKATKGPMGTNKSRRQADYEADHGINGSYSRRYNEGKKVRDAEAREKEYSNYAIKKDMNKYFNNEYKELYKKYSNIDKTTAADKAYSIAKKENTRHLIDTYGKERMDKYYSSEKKKAQAAAATLVSSLAIMGTVAAIYK